MSNIISKLTTAFGASENRSAVNATDNRPDVSKPKNYKTDFVFPQSIQSDLFDYLKPEQQEILKPILRIIKRPYQEILCISLLDYLEGLGNQPIGIATLDCLMESIIEVCELHPLSAPLNN